MADITRRDLMRLGLGAGGAVVLLAQGGRALAQPMPQPGSLDDLPPTTSSSQLSHFGFMFPDLPPFKTDFTDTAAAVSALQALAASMLDPNITTANNRTAATFGTP